MLLQSPIISLIRPKVEFLKTKINQILYLSETWLETQNKVNSKTIRILFHELFEF